MHRQHFRGEMYHVVHDPSNNQFFQLPQSAYEFVALLDGRHTVGEIWKICNDKLGDNAPTQGEAIRLLGQLYTSNLIHAELPPDAESLFTRFRRRKVRETQSFLANLLFLRIPVLDPDHFLNHWLGLFGRLFTWYGLAAWILLVGTGLFFLSGHFDQLLAAARGGGRGEDGVLAPSKLPLLYVCTFFLKVLHEFGHAFACKRLGRIEGGTGEVHEMGVMFMVLMPMAYVDASVSWSFRSKWRRIVVGAAGMMVELAVAAVAAIVWANTTSGMTINAVCYNVLFVAGVSTVLFNANPLLRYDGYYMLSDLLEIPNLAQRSRQYLQYLVKKYAWGIRLAQDPSHTQGERGWLVVYGIASTIYRVMVSVAILLFVSDQLFILGALLAIAAIITWVLLPLGKLVRYLFVNSELARNRGRALATTGITAALLLGGVGLVPTSDHYRVEGWVDASELAVIRAAGDGFVQEVLPTAQAAGPKGPVLVHTENLNLISDRDELLAELDGLRAQQRRAESNDVTEAQIIGRKIKTIEKELGQKLKELADLDIISPASGTWVCPDWQHYRNSYLHRGDPVGHVVSLDRLIVRAQADQQTAAMIFAESSPGAQVRVKGAPAVQVDATIRVIHPAGDENLTNPAMGFSAGGEILTDSQDRTGTKANERLFEIELVPDNSQPLHYGQRVVVRFEMAPKPLAAQAWQSLLGLIQKRFHV